MSFLMQTLLFAFLLVGCNDEQYNLGKEDEWIKLECTKSDFVTCMSKTSVNESGEGSFMDGDKIDVYASSSGVEKHFVLTLKNGSWLPDINREELGEDAVLTAYYPASGKNKPNGVYEHSVNEDQNGEGYSQSDLLWSSATLGEENVVSLKFSHVMHRLKINITSADGSLLPEDLNINVKSKLTGIVKDNDGKAEVNSDSDIKDIRFPYFVSRKDREVSCEVILFPQPLSCYTDEWITVHLNGKDYKIKCDEKIGGKSSFEGGKQTVVNLSIKDEEMEEIPQGSYKLSFDANGGTGYIPPVYLKPGEVCVLPEGIGRFEKENAEFRGWTDKSDSYIKWAVGSQFTMGDRDTTIYAAWRILDTNIGGACEEFKNTTQWVYGIKPPNENAWQNVLGWDPDLHGKSAPWNKGDGWYDTDQYFYNLCWAAGASNIIHWWLDQNKEYIERYGYNGPRDYEADPRSSKVFDYFKDKWPDHGNVAIVGFSWFLSGTPDGYPEGGAFFQDVFENKTMTETVQMAGGIQRKQFNELMTKAFKERRGITDAEPFMGGRSHEYTIWGAEYDDEGYICAYYYTNSNDGRTYFVDKFNGKNRSIGMIRGEIVYVNGITHVKGIGSNIPITTLETYSLGREHWEEYFRKHTEK